MGIVNYLVIKCWYGSCFFVVLSLGAGGVNILAAHFSFSDVSSIRFALESLSYRI